MISAITDRPSFFLWYAGLRLERFHVATHKTVNFVNSLSMCFAKKNTVINDLNFVPNRFLMLHPTRAVTLSKGFKAEQSKLTISIRLKIFASKPSGTVYDI